MELSSRQRPVRDLHRGPAVRQFSRYEPGAVLPEPVRGQVHLFVSTVRRNQRRRCASLAALFLAPFMIHELLLSVTKTAFGCHPCRVVSVTYRQLRPFHGGSNARDRDCLSIGNLVTASAFAGTDLTLR
jgi:hypothetical protein